MTRERFDERKKELGEAVRRLAEAAAQPENEYLFQSMSSRLGKLSWD